MNIENWQSFRYDELFEIKKGKRLTKADMIEGDINYIGATDSNNGITAKISNDKYIHSANTITVSYNGSIAEAFYQAKPFWATDDVNVLYPKFSLTFEIALFLCTIINKEKYRFNYGRKWDKEMMQQSIIKLPVNSKQEPDWQWIKDYVKNTLVPKLPQKAKSVWDNNFDKQPALNKKLELNIEKWKEFKISDIFEMEQGKTLSVENKDVYAGETPCINGSSVNNGILCFLSEEVQNIGFKLQKTPCLSLSRVGNSGLTFFQNQDFFIADNAFSLKLKNGISNKYVFLFLSTILDQEIPKYNYGRIVGKNKYLNIKIKLPAIKDGTPDWQFMEDYIKSLPYSKVI